MHYLKFNINLRQLKNFYFFLANQADFVARIYGVLWNRKRNRLKKEIRWNERSCIRKHETRELRSHTFRVRMACSPYMDMRRMTNHAIYSSLYKPESISGKPAILRVSSRGEVDRWLSAGLHWYRRVLDLSLGMWMLWSMILHSPPTLFFAHETQNTIECDPCWWSERMHLKLRSSARSAECLLLCTHRTIQRMRGHLLWHHISSGLFASDDLTGAYVGPCPRISHAMVELHTVGQSWKRLLSAATPYCR